MKYYITKYALSSGVIVADETTVRKATSPTMIEYQSAPNNIWSTTYFHLGEWFTDRDEAIARCEVLRTRKITTLAKQIKRLRHMKFHEEIP